MGGVDEVWCAMQQRLIKPGVDEFTGCGAYDKPHPKVKAAETRNNATPLKQWGQNKKVKENIHTACKCQQTAAVSCHR